MTKERCLSKSINYTLLKICAWTGPFSVVGGIISFLLIAGFVPPPRADWSPGEVYAFYSNNSVSIRIGMVLTICLITLYWIWSAAISYVMRRVEGPGNQLLSQIELLGALSTTLISWAACVFWTAAAFRVELRSANEVMLLNDLGWLVIDITFMGTVFQNCAMGTIFLLDDREQPLIPAWVCWFAFAVAVVDFFAGLVPFFYHGPFSWHGLIGFYLVFGIFFVFIGVVSYYLLEAIKRLENEDNSAIIGAV